MNDFLLDQDGDMKIAQGDFVSGNSDIRNQELILMIPKGGFKQNPTATVGLARYIENNDVAALLRDIRLCFTADGMRVEKLTISKDSNLVVEAPYEKS
jgi:hypothetical protein